jgi:site-specific recombinase XerD
MSFFLDHPNRSIASIRLEIYLSGERSRFKYNTGRSIKPEHWDKKTRRAKTMRGAQGDRNRKLNLILNEYEFAVERIRDLYGSALTKDNLKAKLDEYFHVQEKKPETVLELFDEYLQEIKDLGTLTPGTVEKYMQTRDKWKKFQGKKKMKLQDVTYSLLINYVTFLREHYQLTDNTLHRNINFFKTFLIWNQRNGRKVPDDYKKIKITKRDTDDIALTQEEIKILETIKLDHRLDMHRDMFLIGVYSGQRFSDYSVFEKADVRKGMIIKRAEKTETNSYIPLHPKLEQLLDKYNWEIRTVSSQKFNKAIQQICKKAGFVDEVKKTKYLGSKKMIERFQRWEIVTSHTARRTFITLSSEKGMPDHIIMSITGIRDPKTLKKYKKLNLDSVMDQATKVFL